MRPPCCNACSLFTLKDARALLSYLEGKTVDPAAEKLWVRHRQRLLQEFHKTDPKRYGVLYEPRYPADELETLKRLQEVRNP